MKAERSLKSRALQLLAQRDQSRLELRRKLVRHARGRAADATPGDETGLQAAAEEIDALLDWL
ncbi:MAG: hypothetical protein ABI520_15555, partial [Caldimonas sp.]